MTTRHRPDPALGVFETLLVLDGRPIELERHLDRLRASLVELYGAGLPAEAGALVRERAAGLPLGRVRLTVTPSGDPLACEAVAAAVDPAIVFPPRERAAELRGFALPGGLGEHKWADRSALPTGGGTVPLLLDTGEEVLEAGWANLFAVRDGVLATPAADGRILPGVTRAAAIEVAHEHEIEVEERRLWRDELLAADEVFLTGSVRGVEPVEALDGAPLSTGEVGATIGAGLRRRHEVSREAPVDPAVAPAVPRSRQTPRHGRETAVSPLPG